MYLITREELIAWFVEGNNSIDDFFADKQPLVEIASGEVSEINLDSCIVGKENDYVKFDDLFRYLNSKNIKIYISKE